MNSMNKFIKELEHEIVKLTEKQRRATELISINSYLPLLTEENIWDLTKDEYNRIIKILKEKMIVSKEEEDFINFLINMPDELKKLKKEVIDFSINQKKVFHSIQNKIQQLNTEYKDEDIAKLQNIIVKYKTLLQKINNNDLNIINEIDIIKQILENETFTLEEKLEIYTELNTKNLEIFKNYNITDLEIDEEEVLSEESLEETNMPEKELDRLFEKYHINWNLPKNIQMTESSIQKRNTEINQYKQRLLKYGQYEKMDEILLFLVEKELTFVFSMPEILTRTLLYSTKELINNLLETANRYKIEYKEMLKSEPTLFYPTVSERSKIKPKSDNPVKSERTKTGSLTRFIKTAKWLEEQGFDVQKVYNDCHIVFLRKTETTKKVYQQLTMYGISFKNNDGTQKKGFSALGTTNALEKLDISIECGAYEYFQENISKIIDQKLNLYKVKLAKSKGETEIFKQYKNVGTKIYMPFSFRNSKEYGITPDETFNLYGAVEYEDNNKELYDNILNNNDSDSITEIVLEDNLIKELENNYKIDNLRYNFNGIIISRLKVLRYYQTLISNPTIQSSKEVLIYAITKGSMLNEIEMNIIKECLNQIKNKRRTLYD